MNVADLEETLNDLIIKMYTQYGYSVVEITKGLRKTSIDFVHSLLRDTGHIQAMPRSDYRRKYDVDQRITEACRKKGFSFGRWCLGWKFDPELATENFRNAPERVETSEVHVALQRDFPEVFSSIFCGSKPKRNRKWAKISSQPLSLRIDWNDDRKIFIATIPEHPMIVITGSDWDETYYEIKSACRLQDYISRLNRLIAEKTVE